MSAAVQVPPRKRFTRADVERMTQAGIFDGQRYELIDGDLIDKMGQKPPHSLAITRLTYLLMLLFGERVRIQSPVEVALADRDHNEPEPDLVVTQSLPSAYAGRHPRCDELIVLIEVADTSLRHDLTTKRDLYARAGVGEYWVLDLNGRKLFVHREPVEGVYANVGSLSESESVTLTGHTIPVARMLGS